MSVFSIDSSKSLELFTISFFSLSKQIGGSGRFSISRTAAYFSIKLASKSAKPLHSSFFLLSIMAYLLRFAVTMCICSNDLRRDAVKNALDALIIAMQPHFLQLLDGAFFLALFQSGGQLVIFLFQRFLFAVRCFEELLYFFICVSIAATSGIYFSRNAAICAERSL